MFELFYLEQYHWYAEALLHLLVQEDYWTKVSLKIQEKILVWSVVFYHHDDIFETVFSLEEVKGPYASFFLEKFFTDPAVINT
ncbi:hypothetical protein ACUOFC_47320, partial [Escherichia sp. TWPC-MK]